MGFSTPSPLTGRRKTHHFDRREALVAPVGAATTIARAEQPIGSGARLIVLAGPTLNTVPCGRGAARSSAGPSIAHPGPSTEERALAVHAVGCRTSLTHSRTDIAGRAVRRRGLSADPAAIGSTRAPAGCRLTACFPSRAAACSRLRTFRTAGRRRCSAAARTLPRHDVARATSGSQVRRSRRWAVRWSKRALGCEP